MLNASVLLSIFALVSSCGIGLMTCVGKIRHYKSCCCSIDLVDEPPEDLTRIKDLLHTISESRLSDEEKGDSIVTIIEPMSARSDTNRLSPKKITFETSESI